ncbi:helix-turn-helix domain-containing protein, partial [Megasphaera sp.]
MLSERQWLHKVICSIISSKGKEFRKSRQVMIVNKACRYRLYPTTEQKMM